MPDPPVNLFTKHLSGAEAVTKQPHQGRAQARGQGGATGQAGQRPGQGWIWMTSSLLDLDALGAEVAGSGRAGCPDWI